ncbi:tyrosine-protein phosphatase [Nocardia gamkensis]|uniref:tyrosine-protein phosphatase n=1 Tax=Nocardia gamkensis TaxID=352869 RepID=UPI0036E0549A
MTGVDSSGPGILRVEAEVMRRFLAKLSANYGGATEWLLTNGLTTVELARLRTGRIRRSRGVLMEVGQNR